MTRRTSKPVTLWIPVVSMSMTRRFAFFASAFLAAGSKPGAMTASTNRDELQEMINRGAGVVAGAGLGRPGGPGPGLRPPVRPGS